MTFTEADLIPLKEALLTGAQSVSVAGRTVTFRSLDDLRKTIAMIEASIAQQEDPKTESGNVIKAKFIPRRNFY